MEYTEDSYMQKTCIQCSAAFEITEDDLAFYKKFEEEPNGLCSTCDHKRRLCFRNGRHIYRRTCDYSGESIISIYAPDKPYTVYKSDIWYGDSWDPLSFGQEVDFNRPFFDQLQELLLRVPRLALTNINPTNSDYCNMCEGNKNCYLIFGGDFNEDCLFGIFGMRNRSCMDCDSSNDNERCYYMNDSFNCYECRCTFDSKNCRNCSYVSDCTGCSDCILCTNLAQKQYCIENQQYTKEEYKQKKEELLDGRYETQQKNMEQLLSLRAGRIVRPTHMLASEKCSGDNIINSKNCQHCYDTWDCEDMRHVILASTMKDGFHSNCIGHKSELCFDMQSTVNAYNCRHSFSIFDSQNIEYSDFILNSKNIFGSTCLQHQEYCILNKQYEQRDFENLRTKLIDHMKRTGEWGKFLPQKLAQFGYNESTAFDYFPLSKEEALAEGFQWYDKEEEQMNVKKTIPASGLPDAIDDIPDDVLQWAIACEKSKKPFRIVKQELDFYREHRIPLPRLSFDERHLARLKLRNSKQLWDRQCAKCSKDIQTTYAPERKETVYCEECYLAEVY